MSPRFTGGGRVVAALVALLAAAIGLGACGSGSSGQSTAAGSTTAGSGSTAKPVHVINVNVPPNAPYSSAWKLGTEQAAKDLGNVTTEWLAPSDLNNPGPDLAQLGRAAVAKHPDAIIFANYLPDAQGPGIRAAVKAGIAVWEANGGGQFNWERDGALGFFGADERQSGEQSGRLLAQAGVHKGLCVNHVPGNPGTEARCAGFADALAAAGADSKVLTIPSSDSSNPTAVTQDIKGALKADGAVDGVYTLGSDIAEFALKALDDSGEAGKVEIGTSDLSVPVLKDVRDGKLLFAIDQQTYLQGYLSVVAAVEWARYGLRPIGVVATGPLPIMQQDAARVLALQSSGVRGAG